MSLSVRDRPAQLQLWFAGPALLVEYDPQTLTPADKDRETARLSARKAYEWRVSRALQRRLHTPYRSSSLSHSAGHALWAASSVHEQLGVDLERIREIDELALAELIANDDELRLLRDLQGSDRRRFFFRLWTLKEALIKAVGGDFPADMPRVGLRLCASNPSAAGAVLADATGLLPNDVVHALQVPISAASAKGTQTAAQHPVWRMVGLGEQHWQGVSGMIGDHWMMAVVWSAHDSLPDVHMQVQQATPGDAHALPLAQCVYFGARPQIER